MAHMVLEIEQQSTTLRQVKSRPISAKGSNLRYLFGRRTVVGISKTNTLALG